jgi:hypothetical protein
MKKRRNNVVMNLKAETEGIELGFGAKAMTIKMAARIFRQQRDDRAGPTMHRGTAGRPPK